ncbi:hypothetical protein ACYULU_02040 [Breznakiellaceae bacterium SP9]
MNRNSFEALPRTILRIFAHKALRKAGLACIGSIFYHFFFIQYKAVLFPWKIPVSQVDHPLDAAIPFTPQYVNTYLDFIAFWIRVLGFILKTYKRKGIPVACSFLSSMGSLYQYASQVYSRNLSSTRRPFYISRPRFALIHATDPHLMCIPSLHVMVVIRTYTALREMLRSLGDAAENEQLLNDVRQGALAITEAVLYVKQHSVNCISAAMYAMTRFSPELFGVEEAQKFCAALFMCAPGIAPADVQAIRAHIFSLYQRFITEGTKSAYWYEALLDFLKTQPQKQ